MQLNVPVHQTITLPDEWQACKTPQELSYWLIAKLDGIQAAIDELSGGDGALTELQEQVTALQTKVDALNSRVAGLTQTTVDVQGGIEENKTNIATNTTNIATLRTDLQTTNENLSGFEDRVSTNSANIATLRTDLQTTNENLSGFEDRVSTNSANIEELKLHNNESNMCNVNYIVEDSVGKAFVYFSYLLASSDKPNGMSDIYNDMLNTNYFGTTIPASGTYITAGLSERQIIGVSFNNNLFTIYYFSSSQISQKNFEITLAASNFASTLIPLIKKSDA